MEVLKELFAFLTDANRHFSAKAGIFILIILTTILVNNVFGFTYYYNINNKIEKTSAINKLLQDSTTSKDNRAVLVRMRDDILNRQTAVESAVQLVSNTYKRLNYNSHKEQSSAKGKEELVVKIPERNNTWFLISSSGIYAAALITIIPLILFYGFQTPEPVNFFTGAVISGAVLYSLAAFNYYTFGLIPIIRNNWSWNYALNFLLQVAFLFIMGLIIVRSKRYQNLNS